MDKIQELKTTVSMYKYHFDDLHDSGELDKFLAVHDLFWEMWDMWDKEGDVLDVYAEIARDCGIYNFSFHIGENESSFLEMIISMGGKISEATRIANLSELEREKEKQNMAKFLLTLDQMIKKDKI